jgi:hypothetical protein
MSSSRRFIALTFQRPAAGARDAEAKDLNRLAPDSYDLGLCRRESFTGKTGKHVGREPIRYEDRVAEAARDAFE